jgi:hypothetical protein
MLLANGAQQIAGSIVGRARIELATVGLKVRCSAD